MAKNSKGGKVIQMLTPENYIRKKSRSIPIYECSVNKDWQKSDIAHVMITRKHTNGNITLCSYLIDLYCLGIKDTMFKFNIPMYDYNEIKEEYNEEMETKTIKYTLAHNIIYSAIEFAEDYGFAPCKDFTSITQFFLEEDNDDIELIDVECGMNGKPTYVKGPYDSDTFIKQITAKLEKTAGLGNFSVIDEDDLDYDDLDYPENQYEDVPFEEKKRLFLNISNKINSANEKETAQLMELTLSLSDDLTDVEKVQEYYNELASQFDFHILYDYDIPDELLGVEIANKELANELKKAFCDIYFFVEKDLKKAKKELKHLKEKTADIPAFHFLELFLLEVDNSKKHTKILKEYANKYNDYPLIYIDHLSFNISNPNNNINLENMRGYPFTPRDIFPGRDSLHEIELFRYLLFYQLFVAQKKDIDCLKAYAMIILDLGLKENELEALTSMIFIFQVGILIDYFKQ